jgi:hypothetical protein
MSKIALLLERLAEMFPSQDYQNRLEQFIRARNPVSASEVEHLQKQFEDIEFRKFIL